MIKRTVEKPELNNHSKGKQQQGIGRYRPIGKPNREYQSGKNGYCEQVKYAGAYKPKVVNVYNG